MTLQEITIARRIRIDALIKVGALLTKSSETTLAFRSLQMAKHSLGNVLKELGGEVPYNVVSDVSLIPPTADTAESGAFELSEDHLENINAIREAIEVETRAFKMDYHLILSQHKPSFLGSILFEHYLSLCNANNWYEEELVILREKAREMKPFTMTDLATGESVEVFGTKVKAKTSEMLEKVDVKNESENFFDIDELKKQHQLLVEEEKTTKKKSASKRNVKTEDDKYSK